LNNIYYVYIHRRATDNKVFYVGKGKLKRAWSIVGRNKYWKNVYNKHGFTTEIVYENLSENDAFILEKDVILEMKYHFQDYITNMTDGGEGVSGLKQSTETIAKRVAKNTGKKRTKEQCKKISIANTGKTPSATTLLKMRIARKGIPRSLEAVIKTAISNTGKTRSDEIKARMKISSQERSIRHNLSEKMSGSGNPAASTVLYKFQNLSTNALFIGTRIQLCEEFNLNRSSISNLFSTNKRKSACGWKIIKDENVRN
jgi:hypothetical protein